MAAKDDAKETLKALTYYRAMRKSMGEDVTHLDQLIRKQEYRLKQMGA